MSRHELYDLFLKQFPLEKLQDMTLEEYSNLNRADSFCYWLESKTQDLGSIWGGSAYKFQIFKYDKKPQAIDKFVFDDQYTWYMKYQSYYKLSNATEVFEFVKANLVEIANNAKNGNFEAIDSNIIFGEAVKWKIAFLYSNKSIVPIYKKSLLEKCAKKYGMLNTQDASIPQLQKFLMWQKGTRDFFVYYDDLLKILEQLNYWMYSPGEQAFMWSKCTDQNIMCIGWDELGDFSQYRSRDEIKLKMKSVYSDSDSSFMNDSLAVWDFGNTIKEGDVVFVKQGRKKIIGRGIVKSDYYYDTSQESYANVRKVEWTNIGLWDVPDLSVIKTLTDITKYPDYVRKLEAIFTQSSITPTDACNKYSREQFLSEVYISETEYNNLKSLLLYKKNLILQGAPGVGKTFAARRLAYSIIGEKDESRIEFVQFHQNYSYEDFVMGYKPSSNGSFKLEEGVFYKFCKKAQNDPSNEYFFIIDEINRGNLSKIFGELFMLIENEHRGENIKLAYKDEKFQVPGNLFIIGMMNTADRSLAMIDYALRRRFCFYEMEPAFENDSFKNFIADKSDGKLNKVIEAIKSLNKEISNDDSLGLGFRIGHSYFCSNDVVQNIGSIINYEIIPMIGEYWFDNNDKFKIESDKLKDSLQ